jgi:hypothetical protein
MLLNSMMSSGGADLRRGALTWFGTGSEHRDAVAAAWLPKSKAIQLFHHATEAAHVLLATSRKHARRFALAMTAVSPAA